jgi:hypothetical protein
MPVGWEDVSELQPPTGLLFINQVIYEHGESWWNSTDRRIPKNLEKNPISVSLCLQQILYGLNRARESGHQYGRLASNRLSYRTAVVTITYFNSDAVVKGTEQYCIYARPDFYTVFPIHHSLTNASPAISTYSEDYLRIAQCFNNYVKYHNAIHLLLNHHETLITELQ